MSEFKIKLQLTAPSGARKTTAMNVLLNLIEAEEKLGFTDLNEKEHSFTLIYKEGEL